MKDIGKILLDVDSRKKLIHTIIKRVNKLETTSKEIFHYYNKNEMYPHAFRTMNETISTYEKTKSLFPNNISTFLGINLFNNNPYLMDPDYGITVFYYQRVKIDANQCFFGESPLEIPEILTKNTMNFQIIGFKIIKENNTGFKRIKDNNSFIVFCFDNNPDLSFIVRWETSLFSNYENDKHVNGLNLINLNQKILLGYYKLIEKMTKDDTSSWFDDLESKKVRSIACLELINNRKLKKSNNGTFTSKFFNCNMKKIINNPEKFKAIDNFIMPEDSKGFKNEYLNRLVLTLYVVPFGNHVKLYNYHYHIPLMSFLEVRDS